ncbi:hypothetical protein AVEN_48076-1 [Araneus ventricosus]|uniref:Uncharacterized protein n=1 Tax=Araneus ventricosus TaxID=182803 RepID=A0A4Y2TXU6_ARAVE|nr:hypothetical protein AVEN_48076-1 [Araneus ventricosus]
MAQRGQKRRAEETEEQRNRGLSHMAQRELERKTEETEEQRNSRLSDMAQRSQERRAKEIRRTKEWSIDNKFFNSLELPGVLSDKLRLKVGVPVLLIRNIDVTRLCTVTNCTPKSKCRESVLSSRIPLIPKYLPSKFKW